MSLFARARGVGFFPAANVCKIADEKNRGRDEVERFRVHPRRDGSSKLIRRISVASSGSGKAGARRSLQEREQLVEPIDKCC